MIPASLKHEFSNGLVFQGVPVVPTLFWVCTWELRLSRVRLSELRQTQSETVGVLIGGEASNSFHPMQVEGVPPTIKSRPG